MTQALRQVRFSCKLAGGSQEFAPRVIAMVRDIQKLKDYPILELLEATETYLQQVQSTGLCILTIVDEWIVGTSQDQIDAYEEYVTHVFPKMLEDARAGSQSIQNWQQQQQEAAETVVKSWQHHVRVASSEEAGQETVGEARSTQTRGAPVVPQTQGSTQVLINASLAAVTQVTVENQRLAKKKLGIATEIPGASGKVGRRDEDSQTATSGSDAEQCYCI